MGKVLTRKDLDLGNRITVFGSFHSEEGADLFMEALAELTGAVEEEG